MRSLNICWTLRNPRDFGKEKLKMKYVRCILKNDNVDEVIRKYGLKFKCDFSFYDLIYVNRDGTSITDDTLKIRVYQINHWNNKNVLVIRKVAPVVNGSKEDRILLRKEFDTIEEAQKFVNDNLLEEYIFAFKLQKSGIQYGNGKLDLWKEDVLDLGISVEIGSEDETLMEEVLTSLDFGERLTISLPEYMYERVKRIK